MARDQAGNLPPSVEIFHLPPGREKASQTLRPDLIRRMNTPETFHRAKTPGLPRPSSGPPKMVQLCLPWDAPDRLDPREAYKCPANQRGIERKPTFHLFPEWEKKEN